MKQAIVFAIFYVGFANSVLSIEPNAPPVLVPAVVYKNHLFIHSKNPMSKLGYAYINRNLDDWSLTTIRSPFFLGVPRNEFESMFIRGEVLVIATNASTLTGGPIMHSSDIVFYLSPNAFAENKFVAVEPSGEPVPPKFGFTSMWRRVGFVREVHTATAARGERDLLIFDLIHNPLHAEPNKPPKITVTRITPEERARPVVFSGSNPQPEVKVLEDVPCEFTEPFQAYVLGDDYYFLTKSGLVYRSPPAEKGKPRAMAAVWGKDKPRVRFIISDGNKEGVHVLVTYREQDGKGSWEFFRLGPDLKPTVLDADVKVDEVPVEAVYQLARALVKAKEITSPPPPKKP